MDRKQLEKIISQSEKTDLPLLLTAKEEAKNKVRTDPSPSNLAALDRATRMLTEYLEQHPVQGEGKAVQPLRETKSAMDVLRWLQDHGYQIEKTKLYEDVKAGFLRRNRQGVFTGRLVSKYAKTLPLAASGKTEAEENLDLGQQKLMEEITKIRLHNEKTRFDQDVEKGRYILRDDMYRELAARLVVLDTGLERMIRDNARKFIHLAGGDQKNEERLVDAMLTAKSDLLNSYANTRQYQVIIIPDQDNREEEEI